MAYSKCVDCGKAFLADGNTHCLECRIHDGVYDFLKQKHIPRKEDTKVTWNVPSELTEWLAYAEKMSFTLEGIKVFTKKYPEGMVPNELLFLQDRPKFFTLDKTEWTKVGSGSDPEYECLYCKHSKTYYIYDIPGWDMIQQIMCPVCGFVNASTNDNAVAIEAAKTHEIIEALGADAAFRALTGDDD